MHNTTQLNFSTRRNGDQPEWVSNISPEQPLPDLTLSDAKSVTLHLGSENVRVDVLQQRGDGGVFEGEIRGFEPSFEDEFRGMRIGDRIEFDEAHVFGASA